MSDELNTSLATVFLQEADESLSAIEQALIALDANADAVEPLNEVFRIAHTIKGGAAMADFPGVAEFAHRFEDALTVIRDGHVPVTPDRVTVMLEIVDALRGMLSSPERGQSARVRAADRALVDRLIPSEHRDATESARVEHESTAFEQPDRWQAKTRSLRVDKSKLDALLTLSGEIAVARGRLSATLTAIGGSDAALAAAEDLSRLLATLHERVTEMRLVPIGPLFRQHTRTVRDLSVSESKLLQLVLDGEDVEVDATIIEQLRDPLTHLVRNAVDHGIEYPAARRDAGKDPCGTVVLHARHERGSIIVEIRDDGRGMSRDRLLAKARERGLVAENAVLTETEIFALSMAPGLSTAAKLTELSGRGVGMDVVKRNIEAIRGTIEIDSVEGQGTTIRIRLPLTVAIIDGFVVRVADERYVIPVADVSECLTASDTVAGAASGVISLRGSNLPYIRLRHLLDADSRVAASRESVVIVNVGGQQAGLVVDELLGEAQAVIKPLVGLPGSVPGVSGTTVMSDGQVSLIVDVGPLLELAHRSRRAEQRPCHPEHREGSAFSIPLATPSTPSSAEPILS
jgi:two-component system chemotaxis sensor kinase CheA